MDLGKATLIPLSKNRSFGYEITQVFLARQGYKCWVDGAPLTMDEAEGGHIIPFSQGGKTEVDNLVVIRSVHNRRMQDMNAHDYKKMYIEQLETA